MITLEQLKERLHSSTLSKSVKNFDVDIISETFFNNSGMWSDNISIEKCVERCLSWYANECAMVEDVFVQQTNKRIADRLSKWDKANPKFAKK